MSDAFRIGALPPGVEAPKTEQERGLYRSALDFEGVFTQHLVDAMLKASEGEETGGAGSGIYKDMVNRQLNDALIDGGGLGLAGSLYASMKRSLG